MKVLIYLNNYEMKLFHGIHSLTECLVPFIRSFNNNPFTDSTFISQADYIKTWQEENKYSLKQSINIIEINQLVIIGRVQLLRVSSCEMLQ
jgi:hypothetical protein